MKREKQRQENIKVIPYWKGEIPELADIIEYHLSKCCFNHSEECGFLWDLENYKYGEISADAIRMKYNMNFTTNI